MDNYRKFIVFLGDVVMVAISFIATILISFSNTFSIEIHKHLLPFSILFIVWFIVLYIFNLYDTQRIRIYLSNIQNTLTAFSVSLVLGVAMFYLFPIFAIAPKTNLLINLGLFLTLFILWRRFISLILSKGFFDTVAIVGNTEDSQKIHTVLSRKNPFGYKSIGVFENFDDAIQEIRNKNIKKIITTTPLTTLEIYKATRLGIKAIPLLDVYERIYEKIPLHLITDEVALSIINKEKDIVYKLISRTLDIVVSLLVLILTSPFSLLASILILIQDGRPILYTQTRNGENNKPFTVLKFRSMIKESEKNGAVWAEAKDNRITKVGAFLRKTHIDEIPQMVNILRGDISLIGPRPERPEFVNQLEQTIPFYFMRHTTKPGFTGWAQIKFRYARTTDDSAEKLEYDLFYLKNKSLALDIGIILKTIQIIFTH